MRFGEGGVGTFQMKKATALDCRARRIGESDDGGDDELGVLVWCSGCCCWRWQR